MKRFIILLADHGMAILPLVAAALLILAGILVFCPAVFANVLRWCAAFLCAAVGLWLMAAYIRYLCL